MDVLKKENASLKAERLDNIKQNDARVLLTNKTELEALVVAHGSAEELKELTEQVSKMRDEFQEIGRDHAGIKKELSNLKTDNKSVNINDLKRTIIELDAKVEKHAALSNGNFVSLNEPISQLHTLTEEQAKLSGLFHLHVRACSEM